MIIPNEWKERECTMSVYIFRYDHCNRSSIRLVKFNEEDKRILFKDQSIFSFLATRIGSGRFNQQQPGQRKREGKSHLPSIQSCSCN